MLMLLDKCIQYTIETHCTDEQQKYKVKQDLALLYQALKLSLPILMIILLGFSLSLVSLAMQGMLLYYLYQQITSFYCALRIHGGDNPGPGNPETEIRTFLGKLFTEIMVFFHIHVHGLVK